MFLYHTYPILCRLGEIMLKLETKRYIKNPILLISPTFIFIWMILYLFLDDEIEISYRPELIVVNIIKALPIMFFIFILISYEMFYQSKKHNLDEVVCTIKNGKIKEIGSIFFILIAMDGILSFLSFFACYNYYQEKNIINNAYMTYTVRVIIIYVFLPLVLSMFLGMLAAQFKNRITGISVALILYFLFDSTFVSFLMALFISNIDLSNICLLFAVIYRSPEMIADRNYFVTAENVHIYRIIFWIVVCIALIVMKNTKNVFKILTSLLIVVLAFNVAMIPSGASYQFFQMSNCDAWVHDQIYYEEYFTKYESKNKEILKQVKNYKDDFTADSYEMNFDISNQLNAKVLVKPSVKNKEKYNFTLYHGYKVKKVSDEKGNELEYKRVGDFIEIYNNNKNIEEIQFEYSGHCGFFYATSQAVNLPGGFAYYPIPGWHTVYSGEEDEFKNNLLKNKSEFLVNVHSAKYKLYSNLTEKETSDDVIRFEGKANTFLLIGNPYLNKKNIGGVDVIYSEMESEQNPEKQKEDYQTLLDSLKKHKIVDKKMNIFLYQTGGSEYSSMGDGYLYGNLLSIPDYLEELQGGENE